MISCISYKYLKNTNILSFFVLISKTYYFNIKNDHRKNPSLLSLFVIKLLNNKAFTLIRINLQLVKKFELNLIIIKNNNLKCPDKKFFMHEYI